MIVEWFAKRWAKKNLTEENFKIWSSAAWDWASDPNIQMAMGQLFKFCFVEIMEKIKEQKKKNDNDLGRNQEIN